MHPVTSPTPPGGTTGPGRNASPRLLYCSDVPLEASYHGSALIYRLLQAYPPDKLRVIEGTIYRSIPARRLPDVPYVTLHSGHPRLLNTRLHAWYALWLSFRSAAWADQIAGLLGDFRPEAVVTVAHGHLWVTAAAYARQHRLPLHLIVHDDWPRTARLPSLFGDRVEQQFGAIYRAAASRLCVSPFMAEAYLQRYGAAGQVLYPSRALDAPEFTVPEARLREQGRGLVFAFAGTINTPGYVRQLQALATCLQAQAGRLHIFGPLTPEQAASAGLDMPNISLCGLVPAADLLQRLRAEVDVLFVPMSFAAADRANMELSFPSKLADCTAVGLPLLISGPASCSAVRWAMSNPGVAEVVVSEGAADLAAAVARLTDDPGYRVALAQQGLAVGQRYFTHAAAQLTLHTALQAGSP